MKRHIPTSSPFIPVIADRDLDRVLQLIFAALRHTGPD